MNCLGMSGRRLAASLVKKRTTPIRLSAGRHATHCLAGTRCVDTAGSHHRRLRLDDLCSQRTFHASPPHHQSADDDDFALRAEQFGLASREEVALAARDPSAVFLDVRSPPEIEDAPLTTTGSSSRPCVKIWCTMDDTSRLVEQAEQLIPDKDGECCVIFDRTRISLHFHWYWPLILQLLLLVLME